MSCRIPPLANLKTAFLCRFADPASDACCAAIRACLPTGDLVKNLSPTTGSSIISTSSWDQMDAFDEKPIREDFIKNATKTTLFGELLEMITEHRSIMCASVNHRTIVWSESKHMVSSCPRLVGCLL
jgi:hypothetical protein